MILNGNSCGANISLYCIVTKADFFPAYKDFETSLTFTLNLHNLKWLQSYSKYQDYHLFKISDW